MEKPDEQKEKQDSVVLKDTKMPAEQSKKPIKIEEHVPEQAKKKNVSIVQMKPKPRVSAQLAKTSKHSAGRSLLVNYTAKRRKKKTQQKKSKKRNRR